MTRRVANADVGRKDGPARVEKNNTTAHCHSIGSALSCGPRCVTADLWSLINTYAAHFQ